MESEKTEDYYNVLGINENATKDEIKKAYRSMQMKYHPDKRSGLPDAENIAKKINEAYETLGDESKKREYDHMRKFSLHSNPFMGMGGMGGMNEQGIDDLFNLVFGMGGISSMGGMGGEPQIRIFRTGPMGMGGMGGMGFQEKPAPIKTNITISLLQVFTGADISFEIERWVIENGNKVYETELISINVPKGIDDGDVVVLKNKGNVIHEMIKGDINVFIKIENETCFKREGLDLILEKNITLKESLCGFSFDIKYINDKTYTLNNTKGNVIPPEYKKIYPNMGLKRDNYCGNMIIHFHVDFPPHLSIEQIDKLTEIL